MADIAGEVRIHLTSRRFAETTAFYANTLGLPVLEEHEEPGDRGVVFALSAALLEVFEASERHPFQELCGVRLSVEVTDVDVWYEHLVRDKALGPLSAPQNRPWRHRTFTVVDPNGLSITFYSSLRTASHHSAYQRR